MRGPNTKKRSHSIQKWRRHTRISGVSLIPTDPAAAIAPLQHAAELMPDEARTKWLLGVALEAAKKDSAAIEQYEAADKLDPEAMLTFAIRWDLRC